MSTPPEARLDEPDEDLLRIAAGALARSPSARTEDLAQALGLSRATLHRRFGRREHLVARVRKRAERSVREIPARAELGRGDSGEALNRLLDALQDAAPYLAFLYEELGEMGPADEDPIWEKTDGQITAFFRRGQAAGAFRRSLSPVWMTEALYALAASGEWAALSGRIPLEDVARQVASLFRDGVREPG